jgi:hypothetical protein
MPTSRPPAAANSRAKRFAAAVTVLVREALSRVPERQVIADLDALHGQLGTELWATRMELESVGGPAPEEDEPAAF